MATESEINTIANQVYLNTGAEVPSDSTQAREGSRLFLEGIRNSGAEARRKGRPNTMRMHPDVVEAGADSMDALSSTDWEIRGFATNAASDPVATAALDTDNVMASALETPASIKLTHPAQNSANGDNVAQIESHSATPDVDFTGGDTTSAVYLKFRFYVHPGAAALLDRLYYSSLQGTAPGAVLALQIWGSRYDSGVLNTEDGWYEIQTRINDADADGNGQVRANFNGIDRHRIQINVLDEETEASVTWDRMSSVRAPSAGKYIAMRDDDTYESAFDRAKVMAHMGIPVSFATHGAIANTDGYMSVDQLKELEDMGHLVVNHGWNKFQGDATSGDFLNLFDLDEDGIREHLLKNADWMYANGFEDGALIWVVHQGRLKRSHKEVARDLGFKMVSNVSSFRINSEVAEPYNFIQPADGITWHGLSVANPTAWDRFDLGNATTEVMRPGDVCIPFGHGLDILLDVGNGNSSYSLAQVEQMLAAAADTTHGDAAKFVTLADLANNVVV